MELSKPTKESLISALKSLKTANIPFLVAGAYAIEHFTGYLRHTKGLELFLRKDNVHEALNKLSQAGFATKLQSDHWLAIATKNDSTVNLIFGASNWVFEVDDSFFSRGVTGDALGIPTQLLSPEDLIWTESYVQARQRFDGAGITHLINASRGKLDWNYLLNRFGPHWQLLLSDLLLYGFVYPSGRDQVPQSLMTELLNRMQQLFKEPLPKEKVCRGTLLDRFSFVYDVEQEGYKDARVDLAEKHGYSAKDVAADRKEAKAILQAALNPK